nr:LPXTG cell wall anchor domain-containing protein [Mobiluncus mulieris]
MLWLLGAAGTMLAGAVALMVRNRRRDVNNA